MMRDVVCWTEILKVYFFSFLFSTDGRSEVLVVLVAESAARWRCRRVPQWEQQIPVLASPGLSCSDSVPAVVVEREGGGRERERGRDKTWCCILEQASAGHVTWGISETETEKNMDIRERTEDPLSVKWPSCVWWESKARAVMVTTTSSSQCKYLNTVLTQQNARVGPQDGLQPCSVFRMPDWSVLISNKRFVYHLSPRISDKQLTGGLRESGD